MLFSIFTTPHICLVFFWVGCSITLSERLFCSWTVYFASMNEERHLKPPAKGHIWEGVPWAWYPYRDALFMEAALQLEQHWRQFWRAQQPLPILSKEAKKSCSSYSLLRQNQPLKATMELVSSCGPQKWNQFNRSLQGVGRNWRDGCEQ